jgi:hypothetical protein
MQPQPRRTLLRMGTFLSSFVGIIAMVLLWVQPVAAQASGPVYALPGTLSRAFNRSYDTILTTQTGAQYGLVGQTPDIESTIVQLRDQGDEVLVKVWGDRYDAVNESELETIVVFSIQAENPVEATATPAPTTAPTEPETPAAPTTPIAVVEPAVVNVRSGPGTNYPPLGTLISGQTCSITGRNQESTWWQLNCPGATSGWVLGDLLAVAGPLADVPVAEVAPPPTPAPTPAPPVTFANWKSSFFSNRDLSGTPVLVTDLPNVNFNWGDGAPGGSIPADNFSARFERTLNFNFGTYEIALTMDDGARLFIDDQLVIDDWQVGSTRTRVTRQVLSGSRRFRIEYFEAGGNAQIQLAYNLVSSNEAWQATYFNNTYLQGPELLTRGEPRGGSYALDYNWGRGAPAAGVPADQWSARWVGTFNFEGGDYRFIANVDDGIRVYIDGIRILDEWLAGYNANVTNTFHNLGAGNHQIVVEYQELAGDAIVRLWWERITGGNSGDNGGRPRDE